MYLGTCTYSSPPRATEQEECIHCNSSARMEGCKLLKILHRSQSTNENNGIEYKNKNKKTDSLHIAVARLFYHGCWFHQI